MQWSCFEIQLSRSPSSLRSPSSTGILRRTPAKCLVVVHLGGAWGGWSKTVRFWKWYWLTHDLHVMGTSSRHGSSKLQHSLVIHQDITYCWKAKVGFGDMWINCWVVQISWKENPFWQICPLRLYACKMSPLIFGTSHQLESCIWTAQKKGLHPLKIPATPLQDTLIYMLGVAAQSLKAREVPATTGPRFWEGWYNTDTLVKWT